ncbi:MAG TPA: hypothetical protein VIN61_04455 [Gammaproteobacteria bacterium]
MRLRNFTIAAAAAPLLAGCGVLDELTFLSPPRLDPSKVYLGTSIIDVPRWELERYACVEGPLLCENAGAIMFTCRCSY